jgi:putative transposase
MSLFHNRQGQMGWDYTYFYTETIQNFSHLLVDDKLKMVIIQSLQYLVKKELITVYGFVIMPNHIHLLWSIKVMNGKESPAGSFSKFTAHEFKKYLLQTDLAKLATFSTDKIDRKYHFWKRDPLAIQMSSELIFTQRLNYIHNNPLQEKWKLCKNPEEYRWSSAKFYLTGEDEFGILKNYRDGNL